MRPPSFPDPRPARVGGVSLWRREYDATADSAALASALLGQPVWRDAQGRPRVGSGDLSIAHAGRVWLLAASRERVGVDIEPLRERGNALELARAHFPAAEADWLARLAPDRRSRAFLRLWCAREAVLKAMGRGLAGGFDAVEFGIDARRIRAAGWRVIEFVPARGYLGALVVPAKAGTQ
jgi:4'-phosphopantetheinyl transferase